jgi:hypothetical protein
MKYFFYLLLLSTIWSCNDCSTIRCASGEFVSQLFTLRDNTKNLLESKSIDIKSIRAFDLDSSIQVPLKADIFAAPHDTIFRMVLTKYNKKVRLKWPQDSIDLDIQYKIFESDCCPDQTTIQQIRNKNNAFTTSGDVFIIRK